MTKVLYTEEQILKRVGEIAREVEKDFADERVSVVGLLEDSFVFMADLIRKVNREVLCYFMKADVDEGEDRVAISSGFFTRLSSMPGTEISCWLEECSTRESLWITLRSTSYRVVHVNSRFVISSTNPNRAAFQ